MLRLLKRLLRLKPKQKDLTDTQKVIKQQEEYIK